MSDYYISARALTACSGKVCPPGTRGSLRCVKGYHTVSVLEQQRFPASLAVISRLMYKKSWGFEEPFEPSQRSEKLETQDHADSTAGHAG